MIIERKNGGYRIYTTLSGFLFQRFYLGYTKRVAVRLFKQECRKEQ